MHIVTIGEPDAIWVYGAGVVILLVSYGRTVLRRKPPPEARIIPSSSNKKLNQSVS